MTPAPKSPKRGPNWGYQTPMELHKEAMRSVEEAIHFEPDDAIVRELTRIWRKMGKSKHD